MLTFFCANSDAGIKLANVLPNRFAEHQSLSGF